MRKTLGSFIISAALLHATVASTAQWELRTTGNDSNGAFFVAGLGGTDFSQQNAAQYTFADLASANATTTCVVTSASHNFVAADVGNGLHISAGTNWTTGWYEIISAAANAATLDRACGSAASVSSGTYFVGGGVLTPGGMTTALGTGCGSGNASTLCGTVNVQSGTYTVTATIVISASSMWQGYNTTHADNGTAPLITTATNSTDLIHTNAVGAAATVIFDNMSFSNTAGTSARGLAPANANAQYLGIRNCTFSGFSNVIDSSNGAFDIYNWIDLIGVEMKNSTSHAIFSGSNVVNCVACYIHNNTGDGVNTVNLNAKIQLINSIISNNNHGVGGQGSITCENSDIANNTSDGIVQTGSGGLAPIATYNCIYYGNGGWGINQVTGFPLNTSLNNAYGSNTSGARNNYNAGLNDVTLTANPFTSATNFALNATVGGGAALKAVGFPGTFPGGTTVSTTNIGATQNSSASSGACTAFCRIR